MTSHKNAKIEIKILQSSKEFYANCQVFSASFLIHVFPTISECCVTLNSYDKDHKSDVKHVKIQLGNMAFLGRGQSLVNSYLKECDCVATCDEEEGNGHKLTKIT